MEFVFSTFWTFLKVLINSMFVSIHTNFVLLQGLELLQCYIIALKKLQKHKVQCGILA
jgi:hypothetical protein